MVQPIDRSPSIIKATQPITNEMKRWPCNEITQKPFSENTHLKVPPIIKRSTKQSSELTANHSAREGYNGSTYVQIIPYQKYLFRMGYNSECFYQDCSFNCCGFWGSCVSTPSDCYYYYNQTQPGVIAGAVIGSIVGVVILIALVCYCHRKRQQDRLREEIMRQNANNPNDGTTIIMQMPNQPAYAQPAYAQPAYAQPAYGQPSYGQPYPPQNPMMQPAYFGGGGAAYFDNGPPPMGQPVYHPQQNNAFAY